MNDFNLTSLAIVEYKINELNSQKKWIENRMEELIELRTNIRKEIQKDYEPIEEIL